MRKGLPTEPRSGAAEPLRRNSRWRFVLLAFLVAVGAFTGGSYRAIMPTLVVLRPLLVLGIGAMAILPGPWDWRALRVPGLLLAVFAATMVIQLVPLPPGWWGMMPGHDRYAGIVAMTPGAWRPISLVPDLTVNSLLALLPALAVLVAFAGMQERERSNTAWIVLALCLANILVGLVQVSGGNGPTAIVTRDDEEVVTGLLANRNHGAVLLDLTLPIVAALVRRRVADATIRWLVLAGATVVVLPLVLLSGSRLGLGLIVLALVAAAAMLVERGASRRTQGLAIGGGLLAVGVVLLLAILGDRALSIVRLGHFETGHEIRLQNLPVLLRITRDFVPFGIGYGAFDEVYRGYEPDAFLVSTYFNHAHDDLLETIMSGGLAALLPLIGLIAWLGERFMSVLRGSLRICRRPELAWAGAAVVLLLLLASLGDYPLRTGIMSSLFAFGCCWLATAPRRPARQPGRTSAPQARVQRGRPMSPVRLALVVAAGVATLIATGAVFAFTAAMVLAPRDPQRAYALWHVDTARAGLASALVTDHPTPAKAQEGIRLATATLAHMPVNIEATRDVALGRLASGNYAAGLATILLGERLSRRDLVTQMWLIEDRVTAGDVAGAVLHYDRALRTTRESWPVLLPVLAAAANDPKVSAAIATRLADRPEWWSDFLGRFVAVGTSPAAFRQIVDGLRLNPSVDEDRRRLATIFARLAWLGEIGQARALFDHVTNHREGFVVDGGFENDRGMVPFGWQLVDEADRSAIREPRDGAHATALSVAGTEGRDVAQQLLALPPGRYILHARSGSVPAGGASTPAVSLACASTSQDPGGGTEIASTTFPVGAAPHAWAMTFTVPAGCPGQWLRIASASDSGYDGDNPWIDDIGIVRDDVSRAGAQRNNEVSASS